jgi:hypothetical protein
MRGQNNNLIASVVIEPTRPFDQNTFMSPPIIDSRSASSARLPSISEEITEETEHQSNVEHRILDDVGADRTGGGYLGTIVRT